MGVGTKVIKTCSGSIFTQFNYMRNCSANKFLCRHAFYDNQGAISNAKTQTSMRKWDIWE